MREQGTTQPDFAREFKASVERAVFLYPELAHADSNANLAFLGEYRRLGETGDPLLTDPTWPE